MVAHLLERMVWGGRSAGGFYLAYCRGAGTVLPVTRQHVSCMVHQHLSDHL